MRWKKLNTNMNYKEYSIVDVNSLTEKENNVWRMKNIVLKCIGGLPENVRRIQLAELISFDDRVSCVYGVFRPMHNDIIISRHLLNRPEAFLATLCHELAHAISNADDATREFEEELSNMLGYISYALVKSVVNSCIDVEETRSLDTYTFAYAGCKCIDCFEERFEWNDDKSYVRCKVCGREYLGGYNELVDLNRKYIEEKGLVLYRQDIINAIKEIL